MDRLGFGEDHRSVPVRLHNGERLEEAGGGLTRSGHLLVCQSIGVLILCAHVSARIGCHTEMIPGRKVIFGKKLEII